MRNRINSILNKTAVLFLVFVMVWTSCMSVLFFAEDIELNIKNRISETYSIIRSRRGRDYSGSCSAFIKDQLIELDVGYLLEDSVNDPGDWFDSIVDEGKTSYGWNQYKYYGNEALYEIAEIYGDVVYDLVVSFEGLGEDGQAAENGHAVFVHAMVKGLVYFSECRSSAENLEGSPVVMTVERFMYEYNNMYGQSQGVVYFSKDAKKAPSQDDVNIYNIMNVGTGKYLNVAGSNDKDGTNVTIYAKDGTEGQDFYIEAEGACFKIYSPCAPTRALSIEAGYCETYKNPEGEYHLWYLERIADNQYIIRSKTEPNMVLTAKSYYDGAKNILTEYSPANKNQIWEFSSDEINSESRSVKITWVIDGEVYVEKYRYNSTPICPVEPVKDGLVFKGWESELSPTTEYKVYIAVFGGEDVVYKVNWTFGEHLFTEEYNKGELPSFEPDASLSEHGAPDYVMYDILPTPLTEDGLTFKVYYVYSTENGIMLYDGAEFITGWQVINSEKRYFSKVSRCMITGDATIGGVYYKINRDGTFYNGLFKIGDDTRYYVDGLMKTGWLEIDGEKRYFSKVSGYMLTGDVTIAGVKYKLNSDGTLYNGYFEVGEETRYYVDGIMQTRWQEIDGKLYYFFWQTGYMVKAESYTIGGLRREFNSDHSVKPVNGWQYKNGCSYYYKDGEMQLAWQEIDGDTYYFLKSDHVYGQMASGWQRIGGKYYYFYQYGTDNYGKLLVENRDIGGTWHEFNEDGTLKLGFVTFDGVTYYYKDGVPMKGWQEIDGKWYYFLLEKGEMVAESRYIGGEWYEFEPSGVCTSKQ